MNKPSIVFLFAGGLAIVGSINAQVLISPGALTHVENFDELDVSTDVSTAGTANPILWDGVVSETSWQNDSTYYGWTRQVTISTDTNRLDKDYLGEFKSNTIRFGNMGNGGSFNTVSSPTTDRALGILMQGANNSASFGIVFEIDTGVTVSGVTINYIGEQWFRAPASNDRLDFQYKVLSNYNPETFLINTETGWIDVDALDFAAQKEGTVQKIDGNYVGAEFGPNQIDRSGVVFPNISPGQFLALRWNYVSDAANAQAALAVDDVSVSFGPDRGAIRVDSTSFTHTENFDLLPTFVAPNPINTALQAFTPLNWGTDPANVDGWDGTGWYRNRKEDGGKDITGVANFLQDNWGFGNIGSDDSNDRALGSLGRFKKSVAFGVVFQAGQNVNGINQASVSYQGEQWWNGILDQSQLDFQYKIRSAADGPFTSGTNILSDEADWIDVDSLDFVALDTGGDFLNDGNTVKTSISQSFTLIETLDEGEFLVIRWLHAALQDPAQYRSGASQEGPTDGLFVDDLSVTLSATDNIRITNVSLAGSTLNITASGLTSGSDYHLESSPDLRTPFTDVLGSTFNATAATDSTSVIVSGSKGFFRIASGAGTP